MDWPASVGRFFYHVTKPATGLRGCYFDLGTRSIQGDVVPARGEIK